MDTKLLPGLGFLSLIKTREVTGRDWERKKQMCCSSCLSENVTNDISGLAGGHVKWPSKVSPEILLSLLLYLLFFCGCVACVPCCCPQLCQWDQVKDVT